jgi:hypothetical protein
MNENWPLFLVFVLFALSAVGGVVKNFWIKGLEERIVNLEGRLYVAEKFQEKLRDDYEHQRLTGTFTAGEAIPAGTPVVMGRDGKLYPTEK